MWIKRKTVTEFREEIKRLQATDTIDNLERQRDSLKGQVESLKAEVSDLKLKRKIEDEDIKHMVKMKQEALDIEHQKKVMEVEKQSNDAIATVKDNYRDKVETNLETQKNDIKEMYNEILQRLPNIKVKMKGDVG